MEIYTEIFKLKKMLEDAKIPFEWKENPGLRKEYIKKHPNLGIYYIFYPEFTLKKEFIVYLKVLAQMEQ